jgi:hypothetical protein
MLPLVKALVEHAVASGIDRGVAVAVLIDLVTSPSFNDASDDAPAAPADETGPVV